MRVRHIRWHHRSWSIPASMAMLLVMTTLAWGGGQAQGGRTVAPGADGTNPPGLPTQQSTERPAAPAPPLSDAAKARQLTSYRNLPLSFEPNQGQTAPQVKFLSQGHGYTLFLTPNEAVLSLYKHSRPAKSLLPGVRARADAESSGVLRMELAGASSSVQLTGAGLLPGKTNYYVGNDPRKWVTKVPNYGRVVYSDVYPGVDLVYYGSSQQQLEYDFVVKPGADPRAIRIAFDLAGMRSKGKNASLSIDGNGDLLIQGAHGVLRFRKPQVYQPANQLNGQGRRNLDGRFVLTHGNQIRVAVAGYDHRLPLIIDPILSYSTFLGGSGRDDGYGIGVDSNNNVYVTGDTNSYDFPGISNAAPSTTYAFVSELSCSGGLVYTAIIGGTGDNAVGSAIYVDAGGNAYITGATESSSFPATGGAFQTTLQGAQDAFVAKLASDGSLTYASYLGGSGGTGHLAATTYGNGIYVDSSCDAYIVGLTNATNLPTTSGVVQPSYGGGSADGFVAEFNPTASGLVYLTYFGGSQFDSVAGIFVDNNGNAFLTGSTSSSDFPTTTDTSLQGTQDAFIAELCPGGTYLMFSTYLGGSNPVTEENPVTTGSAITLDSYGNIYVTGATNTTNFPTLNAFQGSMAGQVNAFVAKMNHMGGGSYCLGYSTYLGGSQSDYANGITVDASGNAYLVGSTSSSNFPTVSPLYQGSSCANECAYPDVFVARLNPEGSKLVFSTFLGGSGDDEGYGVAADTLGNTWLTGDTASTDFPTTQYALQSGHGNDYGSYDAFVAAVRGINPIRANAGFTSNVLPANAGFTSNVLRANANGSAGAIRPGFMMDFFGATYSQLYVNNNGNVTFGAPFGASTPTALTAEGVPPIIAPFWANVDTTNGTFPPTSGTGLVTYGNDTVNGHNAFGVNWIDVGYYNQETDKLNTFQLVLIDREDIATGDFDIEFNYGKIQWEAGDNSGGSDGVCPADSECSPAHVGYSDGHGTDGNYFEATGSGVAGALLDSNASGLIYGGAGGVIGRIFKRFRSGTPEADLSIAMTPSPSPVFLNGNLTYTITVTNNGPNGADASVVTDTIPANSTFVSSSSSQGSCSGTSTVTCNLGWISNGNSATVTLVVTANSGTSLSDTATLSATTADPNSGNNSTGAIITPINTALPPAITKTFGAANIQVNGTTTLKFNIASPEANPATLTGIAFTDSLPTGLLVASPNGLSTTCTEASITATAGSGSVSLTGFSQAPGASCTTTVNVTGTTVGTLNNSVSVTSTNGGAGNTSTASLAVLSAPTLTAAFGASSIPLNGTTSLTFMVTNTTSANSISSVGFTDTLPAGLVVTTPSNGLKGSCGGGAITAAAGSSSISLTGATLAPSASCTFSVNVQGIAAGTENDTTSAVTSNEDGFGSTASASLTVVAPPSITKAFGAGTIPLNSSTSLTFTIANPAANPVTLTGIAFTDTLPTGLVVATPSGLSTTCTEASITATAGSGSVSLTSYSLAAGTSCTITANVAGTTAGAMNNSVTVSSTNGGPGNTSHASLSVLTPPTLSMGFGASPIPLNGSTRLNFTVTNNNTANSISGVGFTDTLPSILTVATPNGVTGSCGGGTISAVAGSTSISLSGATLAASASCTFSVNVQGVAAGSQIDHTSTITSVEGGPGAATAASIGVEAPPSLTESFGAGSIPVNGTTSLTFTLNSSDSNPTGLTGVAFTDTLPAGLAVASPNNGLSTTCTGASITATAGTGAVSLTGYSMVTGASCTITVNVQGTADGVKNNTVTVSSTNGGTGNAASASLTVYNSPSITTAFGATTIAVSGVTSLTFVVNNPNVNLTVTGIAFTDNLPTALAVASPSTVSGTCGGGTITAGTGSSVVSLANASLAPSTSCTFSVNVTGTSASGTVTNSVSVTSANAGTGNTSTANLTVILTAGVLSPTLLTFTSDDVNNPSTAPPVTLQNVSSTPFSITNILVTGTNYPDFTLGGTCGALVAAGTNLAAGASCTITVTFAPLATGNRTGALDVFYNAPGSPQSVSLSGTGVAPTAQVSVTSLAYSHNLNSSPPCPSKPVIIQNNGTGPLLIQSITTSNTSFTQTNTCGTSLAAGASCEIDVYFPVEYPIGTYNGTLTVNDNVPGSTQQTVPLTGVVYPPCPLASSNSTQQLLRTTPSATFNLSDPSPSCHTTAITMACANNAPATCVFNPPTIPPGGSTVLTVQNLDAVGTDNFSFTAQGQDSTNTSIVTLAVAMADFTFTPYTTAATVTAGQTASYALTLTPVNGLTGTVQLSCQGAPSGSTCSVTPATVSVAQNYPVQATVTVTTAGRSMGAPRGGPPLSGPGASLRLWLQLASLMALLALAAWAATGRRTRVQPSLVFRRVRLSALALAALALMLMAWAACGGGGSATSSVVSNPGTPAGTYALTVTGTFSSSPGQATTLARTQSLSLQVN